MISCIGSCAHRFESKLGGEIAGLFYIIGATLTFFMSFIIGKLFKHELTIAQILVARGIAMFLILLYIAKAQGHPLYPTSKFEEKIRMIRSGVGMCSIFFPMVLIHYLPLSEISMIGNLGYNVLCIADYFVNNARIVPREVAGALLSFLGVTMILKPDYTNHLFFGYPLNPVKQTHDEYATGGLRIILILALVVLNVAWAFSIVILKKVKHMSSLTINLPQGILMSLAAGMLSIGEGKLLEPSLVLYLVLMVVGGLSGALNLLFLTRGSQVGKPGMNGVISNVNIVYTLVFDLFYLKEPFNPSAFTGAVIIIAISVTLSIMKMKDTKISK